jgi:nucleoside-diphosphate-sugar epimerase
MNKNDRLISILQEDAKIVNQNVSLRPLEGSSIMITGATGLVGLNLVSSLIEFNNSVENKISIIAVSYNKAVGAAANLFRYGKVKELRSDLSDPSSIDKLPSSDFIIHSAGYGQPGKFLEDKLKTLSINSIGTMVLLKKLHDGGSFVFLSSSEVYSGHSESLNQESHIGTTDPAHSRACYIEGKRVGETIINIAREEGVRASSARLALAYGPGTKPDDKRVLNQLIAKGLKGKIDLLDNGSAMRTYGYISDVVVMLLKILISSEHSTYNVGGKSAISIKDLACKIAELMEVKIKVPENSSFMEDAPAMVGLNLSRVEKEYDLNNCVDLEYGLKQTIRWIKTNNE